MSLLLLFVLMTLCAYRLWRLWAEDALPPFIWMRERFERAVENKFGPVWGAGSVCAWCSGWWVCVAVWAVVWAVQPLPLPFLWPWAMSTVVGLTAQVDG